jgi:rRNA maturation protein Nop10
MNQIPKGFVFIQLIDARKDFGMWIMEYAPDEKCPSCGSRPVLTNINVENLEETCKKCGVIVPDVI